MTMTVQTTDRAADRALTAEMRTMVAERGWTFLQAGAEFGMRGGRAGNLLSGVTSWTVEDLVKVSRATHPDDWEDEYDRLTAIAKYAHSGLAL